MTQTDVHGFVCWLGKLDRYDFSRVVDAVDAEKRRRQPKRRRSPETLDLLEALTQAPVRIVAARFGVSRQWCYQLLREEGLKAISP